MALKFQLFYDIVCPRSFIFYQVGVYVLKKLLNFKSYT